MKKQNISPVLKFPWSQFCTDEWSGSRRSRFARFSLPIPAHALMHLAAMGRECQETPPKVDKIRTQNALVEVGLTARRGPKKARRGPNFKFNPGPRSALHHAQPTHMQCICNLNKIENAQLLILNCKYPSVYLQFKKDYSYIYLVYIGHR